MMQRIRERVTPEAVWVALIVSACVVTLWAGVRWIATRGADARLENIVARLAPPPTVPPQPPTSDDKHGGAPRSPGGASAQRPEDPAGQAVVKRILDRYIFNQPPPQRFRQIKGVLGDRVIFDDGRVVSVGEQYDGATVKAIGGDWVQLEHEGQSIVVGVRGGQGSYQPPEVSASNATDTTANHTDAAPKHHAPHEASADTNPATDSDDTPPQEASNADASK